MNFKAAVEDTIGIYDTICCEILSNIKERPKKLLFVEQ